MGASLQDLIAYGEKHISHNTNSLIGNIGNNSHYQICSDQMLAQENTFLKEKIGFLEQENSNLKEIILLLKGKKE